MMTPFEKLQAVIIAELAQHIDLINNPHSGLRAIMISVKLTTNQDRPREPRAVIFSPEIERTYVGGNDVRVIYPAPYPVPEPPAAPVRPPTMGSKKA